MRLDPVRLQPARSNSVSSTLCRAGQLRSSKVTADNSTQHTRYTHLFVHNNIKIAGRMDWSLTSLPSADVFSGGKALVYCGGSISERFELRKEMEYRAGILEQSMGARTRLEKGFCTETVFKTFKEPRIDSKESIPPACVAWRAVTTSLFLLGSYLVPAPAAGLHRLKESILGIDSWAP
jgi:hypothetical protein